MIHYNVQRISVRPGHSTPEYRTSRRFVSITAAILSVLRQLPYINEHIAIYKYERGIHSVMGTISGENSNVGVLMTREGMLALSKESEMGIIVNPACVN